MQRHSLRVIARVSVLLSLITVNRAVAADPATAPYLDRTAAVEARVEDLLKRLTADEKLKLLGGTKGFLTQAIDRLGLPNFKMSDGPCGVRISGPSTAYTAGICLAATWDQDLALRVGTAMGRDCRARGVNYLLAPGMDLYRAPFCGRNFEYFGEDPVLSGMTAASLVKGVQSQGVAATVKHFALNDQEFDRHNLSSNCDDRTLHELQLRGFEIALREGKPECVMNSYNLINGVHATQDSWLNNDVLKGEFGFRGLLMSDWWSCYDTYGMAIGGLDLEMPEAKLYTAEKLKPLIESGRVPMAVIDDKIRRQLRVAFDMGWLDRPQEDKSIPLDDPQSIAANLDEARGGITLLKNDGNLLPLDPAKVHHIVVLGPNSDHPVTGGGGSSYINTFHSVGVPEALAAALPDPQLMTRIIWEAGERFPAGGQSDLAAIQAADAVVVCVGFDDPGCFAADHGSANEREEADRPYDMPRGQSVLIQTVSRLNPATIVVLNSGGSVSTASWIGNAKALLHAYYPGSAGNTALAEILLGKTNPSGKLPFSWEKHWADAAAFGNYPDREHTKRNTYKEGLLLGYRWFDAKNIEPLFPFGFGLSYTQFAISDLTAAKTSDGTINVTAAVRNTGSRPGAEVVELYVSAPETGLPHPVKELKAYGKTSLRPGEQKTVTMVIKTADLASWDPATKQWIAPSGQYVVRAGDSSRSAFVSVPVSF